METHRCLLSSPINPNHLQHILATASSCFSWLLCIWILLSIKARMASRHEGRDYKLADWKDEYRVSTELALVGSYFV